MVSTSSPLVISVEAWVCRRLCSVIFSPAAFIAFRHCCVSVCGDRAVPSQSGNTSASAGSLPPCPKARRCCCCVRRRSRSKATIDGGRVTVRRPCRVFGALNTRPPRLVSSSACSTRSVAPARSTSCQRSASSSPRRNPVPSNIEAMV